MTDIDHFIARWQSSGAAERANYALFLTELADLLGVPRPDPATADVTLNTYTIDRAVTLPGTNGKTTTGYADLYKRDCFVLEAKQGSDQPATTANEWTGEKRRLKAGTARRETRAWERAMKKAKEQAFRYARALPAGDGWPPFLVVADVGYCFDLYADFSRQGKNYVPFPDPASYRIFLDELQDEAVRERLRLLWTDPMALDPARRSARVTRELAARLARLAAGLEADDHAPETVAGFLMRCLFTMFAEDVGLLPERGFTNLLRRYRDKPDVFADAAAHLWQRMNEGGFSPSMEVRIPQFNGGLFAETRALPLSMGQIDLLIQAAEADWTDVEPAIFGTLLERALDPRERHKLGAHFTPRAYVERLVIPTVVEPLRAEWTAAQAAATLREAEGDEQAARQEVEAFHRRLCQVRVLDPACGSGNFLYVTLEHLKRLEGEVMQVLTTYAGQQVLDMTGGYTVSPAQFLGLEVNPRAAAIADVVLWIGYLQWHFRTYGHARRLDPPILKTYGNIREQDAVLDFDKRVPRLDDDGNPVTRWDGVTTKPHPATGAPVPDDTAQVPVYDYVNPHEADWPEADFIVGNPPFIGKGSRMREALGDGYIEALRDAYNRRVPKSADFVMYWWYRAAERVRKGEAERFGFITTNSITQTFNRRIVEKAMSANPPISLTFAVPDHPWVDDALGADVRIAMTVGVAGSTEGRLEQVVNEAVTDSLGRDVELKEKLGNILADLTIGADVAGSEGLKANADVSNTGVMLAGSGFIVTPEEAVKLGLGQIAGLERHIRPYRNGRDLAQTSRDAMVIDLFGLKASEVRERFPAVFQHVYETVKPKRDQNRRKSRRENWWIFGEPNTKLRDMLKGLSRYFVTPETAKHHWFVSLDSAMLPDHMLVVIASDDALHLGVLSSRIHKTWALAAGGDLGGVTPRYNKSRCFETFPFPAATDEQKEKIRQLGEDLDAHRTRVLTAHADLTMTALYNVLETLRAGEPLDDAARDIHDRGLVGVLRALHDDLDAAVATAYGWPATLPDDEILERLVDLNAARAAEEAQGLVRYLRPAYQNPGGGDQTTLDIEAPTQRTRKTTQKRPWPRVLPERMQAVQHLLATEHGPFTAADLAARFRRAKPDQMAPLLATLEVLGLVRQTDDGAFTMF